MVNVCRDCAHCFLPLASGRGKMCVRRKAFDVVNGERVESHTCESERSRLWRWLGFDVCGPEGQYFVKRELTAPPHRGLGESMAA